MDPVPYIHSLFPLFVRNNMQKIHTGLELAKQQVHIHVS